MTRWQWIQLICFQVIWFSCVIGRNQWLPVSCGLLLLHFAFTPSKLQDLQILPLAMFGVIIDYLLTITGIFKFEETPIWLLILWLAFVLNFGHSLSYLRKFNLLLLAVIGGLTGSYAYILSWKLDAVILPYGPIISALLIAVVWALLLPMLVKCDRKIRKVV